MNQRPGYQLEAAGARPAGGQGDDARGAGPERLAPPGGGDRPLLITGATGTLGVALARRCEARALRFVAATRAQLDLSDAGAIARALDAARPWAVVNAAGYVRVDEAEDDAAACFEANAAGPARLAEACARRDVKLLTFSTDLVFDGSKRAPYVESDPVAPLNVYGRSKAEAERRALEALPGALVVRTSAFFGPWDGANFVTLSLGELAAGRPVVASDAVVSPTYVVDLAHASLDLLLGGAEGGIWHLANDGACTWAELARRAAGLVGVPPGGVETRPASELGMRAPRPAYSALGTERPRLMPGLDDALARYVRERVAR
ncbi:MAG TPA: SDR family oxidoreductase [Polyangiaceae bacterium]|nr:SDR family oxidoreductase [Polyangiaceae bacterium]